MRAVLVFVEGAADGWYGLRCLGQNAAARLHRGTLATLPRPFDELVPRWHARIPNERLLLAESSEGQQPVFQAVAATPDGTHLFIVRLGGDGQLEGALDLIDRLRDALAGPEGPDYPIRSLAAAFCFDADTPEHWNLAVDADCVAAREDRFNDQVGPELGVDTLTHGTWRTVPAPPPPPGLSASIRAPVDVGLWVFHAPATRQGTLESLLEPAVATVPGFQDRLEAAEAYLEGADRPAEVPARSVWASASGRAKARLTIAGQLERPGASLAGLVKRGRTPWMPGEVFQTPASAALARFLTQRPVAADPP